MSPHSGITLKGGLLTLRPMLSADHEALYHIAADPLIWEQHPERTRYMPEVFARYLESAMASQSAFVAIDNISGEIIGSSRYYNYDPATGNIAIGYTFLVRRCWANGYNKEMKCLMIDHAFTFAKTISFHVGSHNHRSRKTVEKTGATLYKTLQNEVEYRLAEEQWIQNAGYRPADRP
ncbi:GNAT family N-acetyltransferase [Nemorincola caseinilytica]